jgi:hypothetical protein
VTAVVRLPVVANDGEGYDEGCCDRVEMDVPRRPANALNVEVGTPAARCRQMTPEHWDDADPRGYRWLASGGSPLVLGHCARVTCPREAK